MNRLNILKKIDQKQLYRLFIDGRFYTKEHAWEGYENREPGCIEGMSLAYCYMINNFDISSGLTLKYICNLQYLTILKIDSKARRNRYPGEIRQFSVSFLLKSRTTSKDGLKELVAERGLHGSLKESKKNGYKDLEDVYQRILENKYVRYTATTGTLQDDIKQAMIDRKPSDLYQKGRKIVQQNITTSLQLLIDEYNDKIDVISNDEEKLYFLVNLVKRMVRLHPFVDANARVFINILLNHLLIYHGFLPVIYEEPSIFDAKTTDEILVEIKIGQQLTQQLIDYPDSEFFGHSVNNENEEHHQRLVTMMSAMINKLHNN